MNIEYQASYQYQAMWAYFDRDDVGLPHIAEHFKKMAKEELGHAQEFQSYTTKRGGQVRLLEMAPPEHEFIVRRYTAPDVTSLVDVGSYVRASGSHPRERLSRLLYIILFNMGWTS